jgi:hypothetical protein
MVMKVQLYSKEAGASITFEFDSPQVVPTEALADLFAKAIRKLLEDNPWEGMPPLDVAVAWSIASITAHAAEMANDPEEFAEIALGSLGAYRN